MARYDVTMRYAKQFESEALADATVEKWHAAFIAAGLGEDFLDVSGFNVEAEEFHIVRLDFASEWLPSKKQRDDIHDKLVEVLADLEIQSDEVYLALERVMDTRIDCRIAAG